jgi:antitoxin (DNA-binding transcriptional repressor) of toxin-antitoxin stability system
MEKISITALRQNLFNIIDQVLATGQSVEIERHGKRVLITPEQHAGKLARLKKRALINGDATTLPNEKVWEWDENANRV